MPTERYVYRFRMFKVAIVVLAVTASSQICLADSSGFKFHFNGYLTQAYAEADGTPVLGLTEDGTFDYRSAALLFRFELPKKNSFFVQLAHEALGASPIEEVRDDVELDWAFYQHEFGDGTRLRLGRVPIPLGIYNELRDVGTILEFYRPPVGIYFEGAFSAEAVDGVVVSHKFFSQKSWSLGLDVYGGRWNRAEFIAPDIADGRAEDALGAQLWLNTPVSGLRFGFGAQRFDQVGGLLFLRSGPRDEFDTYLFSVDADLSRFVFRMEAQLIKTSFSIAPSNKIPGYYFLAGVHATDRLDFYLLYEDSKSKLRGGPFGPLDIDPLYEDWAASVGYHFTPNLLLRLEGHRFRTLAPDVALPLGSPPARTDFGILSVAVSF